jgi:hypothetical protein
MIANLTRSDSCPYCHDEGQLEVSTRQEIWPRDEIAKGGKKVPKKTEATVDEYGPCPRCEKGQRMEFPEPDAKGRVRVGPWGPDGFWRGRTPELEPATVSSPLSREENQRRLAELMKRMAAVG